MIRIALDTETTLISDDEPVPRLVCVSYATSEVAGLLSREDGLELFRHVLEDEEYELVLHTAPFDFSVICRADPTLEELVWKAYEAGRIYDIRAAARLDDIARGVYLGKRKDAYTLASCYSRYVGGTLQKEDTYRLRYGGLENVPLAMWPREAIEYPISDVKATLGVANEIIEPADSRRQASYDWWLDLCSNRGLDTDPKRVEKLLEETIEEAGTLAHKLIRKGWIEFDKEGVIHRKLGQVQLHMIKVCREGGMLVKLTDAGQKHLGDEIDPKPEYYDASSPLLKAKWAALDFDACEASKDQDLKDYARLGQLLDVINKDSKYLLKSVVRCQYGLAESGRTTCFSPNLQNLKVDGGIRECFVAPPGYVLLFSDYKGLELHTLAQVCFSLFRHSKLREDLNAGIDPHCRVAAELLKCSYEEAVARCENKEDREAYLARQTGKVANFGMPGGLGAKTLVIYARENYNVIITKQKAEELKQIWLSLYPEMRDYFAWVNCQGYDVEQLFCARRRGGLGFCSLANTMFQGLGGDVAKLAGFLVTKACRVGTGALRDGKAHPGAFVHDEIIIIVREEYALAALRQQEELMIKAGEIFCPDVPLKIESVISRRWSKKAKHKLDGEKVIPWDG